MQNVFVISLIGTIVIRHSTQKKCGKNIITPIIKILSKILLSTENQGVPKLLMDLLFVKVFAILLRQNLVKMTCCEVVSCRKIAEEVAAAAM